MKLFIKKFGEIGINDLT